MTWARERIKALATWTRVHGWPATMRGCRKAGAGLRRVLDVLWAWWSAKGWPAVTGGLRTAAAWSAARAVTLAGWIRERGWPGTVHGCRKAGAGVGHVLNMLWAWWCGKGWPAVVGGFRFVTKWAAARAGVLAGWIRACGWPAVVRGCGRTRARVRDVLRGQTVKVKSRCGRGPLARGIRHAINRVAGGAIAIADRVRVPLARMQNTDAPRAVGGRIREGVGRFLETGRPRLMRAVRIAVLPLALLLLGWLWFSLRPDTWRYWTDDVSFRAVARDVEPEYVVWTDAGLLEGPAGQEGPPVEAAVSPDGATMVFCRGAGQGNGDLFFSRWDGAGWSDPRPARALNSPFNESGPAFSRDGTCLYFATDRPGGPGGYDIWVSRWDGGEFAWPLPLSVLVNSPYNELGPAPSGSGERLYFCSDRPDESRRDDMRRGPLATNSPPDAAEFLAPAEDFDLFAADRIPAGVTNRAVERAMSMLYYLREAALSDTETMRKLGGSQEAEAAVVRALDWLAGAQEADGHWSLSRHGGSGGHDVAATSLALLVFFGRGERHDVPGPYRDTIARALEWLTARQKVLGDVRGSGNFYDQGMAALALGEAYGLTKDEALYDAAQNAVNYISDWQHKDGGWRYTSQEEASDLSVSGWQIMALKNAQLSGLFVSERAGEGIRRWLTRVQYGKDAGLYTYQPSRGNGSPAMIATGLFCWQLMGLSPNTDKAEEAGRYLLSQGARVNDPYYLYYGTLGANQQQGPLWQSWREQMRADLLKTQAADGSWPPGGPHGGRMGKVVATALAGLSLQAHYRYTPMYGLGFEPASQAVARASISEDALVDMPEYRRAQRLWRINSGADDVHPVPTAHGDFLYFASDRPGGCGGLDVYRTRISGTRGGPVEHTGPGINSPADETAPAITMNGFTLYVSSNRGSEDPGVYRLYQAHSRRVTPEINRANGPGLRHVLVAYPVACGLAALAVLVLAAWCYGLRATRARRLPARAGRWQRVRRALAILGPMLLAVLGLIGAVLWIRAGLSRTAWLEYTDGHGLRRRALEERARPILWHTRPAPGALPSFTQRVAPRLSGDGTAMCFDFAIPGETNALPLFTEWDGRTWSRPERGVMPPVPTNLPPEYVRGGGALYEHRTNDAVRGWADLVRVPVFDGQRGPAVHLGPLVNSPGDDCHPAVRGDGFDLLFCSAREGGDPPVYRFYTATAREVTPRLDMTRWHNLTSMLGRIKWWIAAALLAAAALVYILRHWRHLSDLRHKCLLASLIGHLLLLLAMAFWMISAEMIEVIDSSGGETMLNVDNLAGEKLALDLQAELTELPVQADALAASRPADAPDLPEFEVEPAPRAEPLTESVVMEDLSFVTGPTAVQAGEPATEIPGAALDDLLPDLEVPTELVPDVMETRLAEAVPEDSAADAPALDDTMPELARVPVEAPRQTPPGRALLPGVEPVRVDTPEQASLVATAAAEAVSELPELDVARPPAIAEPANLRSDLAEAVLEERAQPEVSEPDASEAVVAVQAPAPLGRDAAPATPVGRLAEAPAESVQIGSVMMTNAVSTAIATAAVEAETGQESTLAVAVLRDVKQEMTLPAFSALNMEPLEEADVQGKVADPDTAGESVVLTQAIVETQRRTAQVPEPIADTSGIEILAMASLDGSRSTETAADVGPRARVAMAKAVPAVATASVSGVRQAPQSLSQLSLAAVETKLEVRTAGGGGDGEPESELVHAIRQLAHAARRLPGEVEPRPVRSGIETLAMASIDDVRRTTEMAADVGPRARVAHAKAVPAVATASVSGVRQAPQSLPQFSLAAVETKLEVRAAGAAGDGEPESRVVHAIRQLAHAARRSPGDADAMAGERGVKRLAVDVAGTGGRMQLDSAFGAGVTLVDSRTVRGGLGSADFGGVAGAPLLPDEGAVGDIAPVAAPGELFVPKSSGRGAIPEVLRNPHRLSDDVVESLGGSAETQRAIASALDWFTANQERDGRWDLMRHGGGAGHDVGGTGLVLLCYYGWGARHTEDGPHRESVARGLKWLIAQMRSDGDLRGWLRRRYEDDVLLGNMYDHAIATIVLCEAYTLTRDPALAEPVRQAVAFLIQAQEQTLGGWRYVPGQDSDTSVLGWAYMALKSAEMAGVQVAPNVIQRAQGWLARVAGGASGGIFRYQPVDRERPAMIATGMFCRQLDGADIHDPAVQESVDYIMTHPLDGADLDYYYLYYATLAAYQYGGTAWDEWNVRMKSILPGLQQKTGRHKGTWETRQWYGSQMGRVVTTAISTLSLEVYYRLLPIYGFSIEAR
jgi:hypothetical protein